jgi:hypothetical protein
MAGTGTVRVLLARKDPVVWSISPDATVFEAIQLMADKNVGALPVIDNSRLVGIISERDYARKVILKGRFSKDTPVRDNHDPGVVDGDSERQHRRMYSGNDRKTCSTPAGSRWNQDDRDRFDRRRVKMVLPAQAAAIDNLERCVTGDYRSPDLPPYWDFCRWILTTGYVLSE